MPLPSKDIHNHLLPGVDDGFRKEDESLAAIERMAKAGCRDIVFTPHLNPDVYPDSCEDKLRVRYEEFRLRIPQEWGVSTHLAAEYMIVAGFEQRALDPSSLLTYADKSILIEMSYYFRSDNLEDTVFNLSMQGLRPVLAHPERYLYMVDRLKDFEKLHDMGCGFQMNLMSLTGCYGEASVKILRFLSERGWYDFRATDLHTLHQLDSILAIEGGGVLDRKKGLFGRLFGRS